MTVLEWLRSSTRYTFDESTFIKIAIERECDPQEDVYGEGVTKRQRELMTADLILTAVILSPSNTSSLSQSHNGYQKTIGSEQDTYRRDKIEFALGIYKKYDDDNAALLESAKRKITFIPIEDVDQL